MRNEGRWGMSGSWVDCSPHSGLAGMASSAQGVRERPTEDPRLHPSKMSFEISCLSSSSSKNTMPFWFFYYYLNKSQSLINCVWDMSGQSLPWGKSLNKMIGTVRENWEICLEALGYFPEEGNMEFIISSSFSFIPLYELFGTLGALEVPIGLKWMSILPRAAGQCIREPLGGSTQAQVSVRLGCRVGRHPEAPSPASHRKISAHTKITFSKQ